MLHVSAQECHRQEEMQVQRADLEIAPPSLLPIFYCSSRLAENGAVLPKHAAVDSCHKLYLMIRILFTLSSAFGD